jgi:hypothetical protein
MTQAENREGNRNNNVVNLTTKVESALDLLCERSGFDRPAVVALLIAWEWQSPRILARDYRQFIMPRGHATKRVTLRYAPHIAAQLDALCNAFDLPVSGVIAVLAQYEVAHLRVPFLSSPATANVE